MLKLPKDFILGGATAAFQAEGATASEGRGETYWDDYLREQSNFDPTRASDFYHKYPEDLKLAHEYGVNGIRISIAWTRIFPNGDDCLNPAGVAFYHRLIDECLKNQVEPFVTLHHFDTPLPLFKQGDWLNRQTVNQFVKFAEFCFKEYGKKVKHWITINEPWSVVAGQYIIGHFPPNIKYDLPKAIQGMHHMMLAHAEAVIKYKQLNLDGEIGIVHILESKYPITETPENQSAALYEHVLANQFMLDATFKGYYTEETMLIIEAILEANQGKLILESDDLEVLFEASKLNDFLGMNYYASHFIQSYEGESDIRHNGSGKKGTSIFALKGVGERVINEAIPTTDWDWPIYPEGLLNMLLEVKNRYPNYHKIYVTENGMGDKDQLVDETVVDIERIEYIEQHLKAIVEASEKGVKVSGYFLWSLMDVFSWTNGYNKRYGLFYVDFETQRRYPKESARWFKKLAENQAKK